MSSAIALLTLFALVAQVTSSEPTPVDSEIYFSSPNYPGLYTNLTGNLNVGTFQVDDGYAFAVFFNRFALGKRDCLKFCSDASATTCVSKCGNEFDHSRPFLYYDASSVVHVFFYVDTYYGKFPGYEGKMLKIAKTSQRYIDESITQFNMDKASGPFFLVSDHFNVPPATTLPLQYSVRLTSSKGIRVTIYAAKVPNNSPITFKGTALNGTQVTVPLPTIYDATAVYFKGDVTINFDFNSTNYSFYMDAVHFDINPPTNGCPSTGTIDVSSLNTTMFSFSSGVGPYANDLDCTWKYTNLPPHSQFVFVIESDSERCCDTLEVTGLLPGVDGIFDFRGHNDFYAIPATENELTARFTTDGLEGYVGFAANVIVLNCECPASPVIHLDNNSGVVLRSPGSESSITYCQNVMCDYTVLYNRTQLLTIDFNPVELYNKDTLTVNFAHSTLFIYGAVPSVHDGAGSFGIHWNSTAKKVGYNDANMFLKKGFTANIYTQDLSITYVDVDICKTQLLDISSDGLLNVRQSFAYRVTSSCGRNINLYMLSAIGSYTVTVFDGSLDKGVPVATPQFNRNGSLAIPIRLGQEITVMVTRSQGYGNFRALATTTAADGSEQFSVVVNDDTTNMTVDITPTDTRPIVLFQSGSLNHANGIALTGFSGFQAVIYKGASLDDVDMVVGCTTYRCNTVLPSFVYGQYLTIKPAATSKSGSLSFKWSTKTTVWVTTFDGSPDIVMTQDFGTNGYGVAAQQISIEYTGDGHYEIVLEMLKPLVDLEQISIEQYNYNDLLSTTQYGANDGDFTLRAKATQIHISYSANGSIRKANSGLLASYSKGEEYTPPGKKSSGTIMTVFMFLTVAISAMLTTSQW